MKFLTALEELPAGITVGLYGAGDGGGTFLRLLARSRPDIRVACFLDDARTGERDGVPILPASAPGYPADLIVVTSTYWRQIQARLEARGVAAYRVAHPGLLFPEQIFTAAEADRWRDLLAQARNLLHEPHDRRLFDLLVAVRGFDQSCAENPRAFFEAHLGRHGVQYLDFIDTARIRTVVEGGVLDGRNTLEFLSFLPPDGFIHGFDPFREAYLEGPHHRELETSGRVRIHPLALWERRARLPFLQDRHNVDGSRIISGSTSGDALSTVDAVSIDELVDEGTIGGIDFLKVDVEGAEPEVLRGARRALARFRPQLAICVYHHKEHLFQIPLLLRELLSGYRFRLGHYSDAFWDTIWYALPEEIPA